VDFARNKDEPDSVIDGASVTGCRVVSVAVHSGNRRNDTAERPVKGWSKQASATSMLYIDVSRCDVDKTGKDAAYRALCAAFDPPAQADARELGPLAELAEVSGTVVGVAPARITFDDSQDSGHSAHHQSWTVTVTRASQSAPATQGNPAQEGKGHEDVPAPASQDKTAQKLPDVIRASGEPACFDVDKDKNFRHGPLELTHTALSYELQTQGPLTTQRGRELVINVGALPGGYIDVTGRSGMRGRFHYAYSSSESAGATAV